MHRRTRLVFAVLLLSVTGLGSSRDQLSASPLGNDSGSKIAQVQPEKGDGGMGGLLKPGAGEGGIFRPGKGPNGVQIFYDQKHLKAPAEESKPVIQPKAGDRSTSPE